MKLRIVLLLVLIASYATHSSTVEQVMPINKSQLQSIDIQHYTQDREILTLSTADFDFISLLKEETTGFPRGIAFIMPDIDQSIGRQAAVTAVYDQLNNIGWTTMVLTMPTPELIAPEVNLWQVQQDMLQQAKTPDAEPIAEQNLELKANYQNDMYSNEYIDGIESAISARIEAAHKEAEKYPGFYLYICQGKTCAWVTRLIQQQAITQPDALVMLSAHLPQQDLNLTLSAQIGKTEFPVLELYREQDNNWVQSQLNERRIIARKNFKTNYRQRKLFYGMDYRSQQRRAVKEIYGFLTAVGM